MLTAKQEAFAQAVASGMNYSDAYRHVYNVTSTAPGTVNDDAWELAHHPEVSPRIAELRETYGRAWARGKFHAELEDRTVRAADAKQFGPSVRALELIGKLDGHLVDKSEHSGTFEHVLSPSITAPQLDNLMAKLEALEERLGVAGMDYRVVEGEVVVANPETPSLPEATETGHEGEDERNP